MNKNAGDELGALRLRVDIAPSGQGPLSGLTFAVKDMFDVAGIVTGGGSPDWLASHGPAARTAPSVQACLDAGARLTGIAIADELAFSPFGENVHYGTPRNPKAPERVPGGSSSGSASATAAGLVDFALGGDTAGSVRIPACWCGLFGMRPTHGRIPLDGVMPLAPSFDTVGWFARDGAMLERVGRVFFDDRAPPIRRVFRLEDAFALADGSEVLQQAATQLTGRLGPAEVRRVAFGETLGAFDDWLAAFNALRPREIWGALGPWIETAHPNFGAKTAARFAAVHAAAAADVSEQQAFRDAGRRKVADLLGDDGVLLLPTAPVIAPKKGISDAEAPALRERIFRLTCITPMLGFPEVTLPLATVDGCPLGLSLLGPPHGDAMLLAAAAEIG
jgi:amidase